MHLDLADLNSVEAFAGKETVVINNPVVVEF
jgi:hypothetical protein